MSKFLITIFAFLVVCTWSSTSLSFGDEYASQAESPWFALIINKMENDVSKQKCGGSLVRERYIITASHCVKKLVQIGDIKNIGKDLEIRLGEWKTNMDPDCDEEDEDEDEDIVCDHYIPVTAINITLHDIEDLALIQLNQKLRFTELIKQINIPEQSTCDVSYASGNKMTVTGFGYVNLKDYAKVKKKTELNFISEKGCADSVTKKNKPNYFCAENIKGLPTCPGDSGSGAASWINNTAYLYGIVSEGKRDCKAGKHNTTFVKVACFSDWIDEKIDIMENKPRKPKMIKETTTTSTKAPPSVNTANAQPSEAPEIDLTSDEMANELEELN